MLVFWSLGCKPQQKVRAPNDAPSVEIVEERLLDTLFVSAPPISKPDQQTDTTGPSYTLPVYQVSPLGRGKAVMAGGWFVFLLGLMGLVIGKLG